MERIALLSSSAPTKNVKLASIIIIHRNGSYIEKWEIIINSAI